MAKEIEIAQSIWTRGDSPENAARYKVWAENNGNTICLPLADMTLQVRRGGTEWSTYCGSYPPGFEWSRRAAEVAAALNEHGKANRR